MTPQNPYDLAHLVLRDARRAPGLIGSGGYRHWLGTDAQGRDLLSAIAYGLRISLQMGLVASGIAFAIGALVGCTAAFVGGRTEVLAMRVVDLQLSFPVILLAFVIAALLGQGRYQLILALIAAQYAYSPVLLTEPPSPKGGRIMSRRRFPFRCRLGSSSCAISCQTHFRP